MARIDWRTFSSATFVTQPASFESLQCAASTAGWILASRPVRLPSCTPSIAPLTAPQLVCPSTTMSFVPTLTAYSRLPSSSSFTTLPPTRTAKRSPIPWSKTISTGARESMQPSTAAKGNWPAAVATTLADQSRRRVAFATKRALPAFRRSSACDGVIATCDSRVCTTGFEGAVAGGSAVATRAPSPRHRPTAEAPRRVEPSCRSGGIVAPGTQSTDGVQPRRGRLDAFAGDLFITWSQPRKHEVCVAAHVAANHATRGLAAPAAVVVREWTPFYPFTRLPAQRQAILGGDPPSSGTVGAHFGHSRTPISRGLQVPVPLSAPGGESHPRPSLSGCADAGPVRGITRHGRS